MVFVSVFLKDYLHFYSLHTNMMIILICFLFLFFWDKISHSLGCPETPHTAEDNLDFWFSLLYLPKIIAMLQHTWFMWYWEQTQCVVWAREASCHLSYVSSPFFLSISFQWYLLKIQISCIIYFMFLKLILQLVYES